ncbi:phospholipase D family protein [Vibrio mediterranei]|uniref:phospholipase D family protein n=1 Tax=Vibrio mediterranei TaxID=689 RepID=UPI0022842C76|nr:phospholipase D family protein [Vibrio mediterranei]MCY9853969.1 phospholipase D family protein [Vibrio mediterranei]
MWKGISIFVLSLVLGGCASNAHSPSSSDDEWTSQLMEQRRWRDAEDLEKDYLKLSSENRLPVQPALVKVIGSQQADAIKSLAAKIYLIENAKHTIDLTYYIFSDDLAGKATLGALCEAVQRGVDIRIMVDSLGSYSLNNGNLKGLMQCEKNAGYIRDREGQITTQKARVQAVVFNALTDGDSRWNHRSHDKLFIVDGFYNQNAYVITGGRNMSLNYYGIDSNGSKDYSAFRDIEVIIRPLLESKPEQSPSRLSEYYFTVLFTKPGNKKLDTWSSYNRDKSLLLTSYQKLKANPEFNQAYIGIAQYLDIDYRTGDAKFAHELDNLNADDVVTRYSHNKSANANSISGILAKTAYTNTELKKIRVVSPYLFLQSDLLKDEGVIDRDLNIALSWLEQDPERSIEVITNSVLTSDNFFTQAVIDMRTVPSLIMQDETLKQTWLDDDLDNNELNEKFLQSSAWKKAVNHPRIKFYQLGKPDSVLLGGTQYYGKLHAKFLIIDETAFVGTTNLDFRSLLYNNEVGFFLSGEQIVSDLNQQFELLKQDSLLWGSEEWLEMRKQLRAVGGMKGKTSQSQREIYNILESTGLKYQF